MIKKQQVESSTDGFVRRTDAAQFLGISTRTLGDWQRRRIVPFVKVSHRVCLFRKKDLVEALERFRIHPVGEEKGR